MFQGQWKKLFIIAAVLLMVSLALGISSWYQLSDLKNQVNQQDQLINRYADLRNQISIRAGVSQQGSSFITPDVPQVSAKVQELTDDFSQKTLWRDYGRIFRWISLNIQYSSDSPLPLLPESVEENLEWENDFWRLPVETIRDGAGDCEDLSLLLTSMLLNYNQRRYPVMIVGVRNYEPEPKAHMAVAIPNENNQLTVLDLTGHYYTPFFDHGGIGTQDTPQALSSWLEHLSKEIPNTQVYVAFSENFYKEFSGNQEFIDWLSQLY